jgi:hypothetical protein
MSGLPIERRVAKFLGTFSLGVGVAQIAVPERVNELIGVKDTPKARMIQRLIGAQELSAGQGVFAFSPPTPILWSRVAGDVLHLGLLANALTGKRNDRTKLIRAFGAVAALGIVDGVIAARYQARWPKEPTGVEPLPNTRDDIDLPKARLRQLKQLIEVGEVVRSDGAPEGAEAKRQIFQRPAKPLKEKELAKVGGKN